MSSTSLASRSVHASTLSRSAAEAAGRKLHVPTLVDEVRDRLRRYGEPVTLFGETKAAVRERLRLVMGRIANEGGDVEAYGSGSAGPPGGARVPGGDDEGAAGRLRREKKVYTVAGQGLVTARRKIVDYGRGRARARLEGEVARRKKTRRRLDAAGDPGEERREDEFYYLDGGDVVGGDKDEERSARSEYEWASGVGLEASEVAGDRPVTGLACLGGRDGAVVTGGWDGNVKLWERDAEAGLKVRADTRAWKEDPTPPPTRHVLEGRVYV